MEQELLFVGNQYRRAITRYYQRSDPRLCPAKCYPEKLEDLLEDKRKQPAERYLRKLYADPLTGKPEWGLVTAPGGGIMGVHSLSGMTPIKTSGFSGRDRTFEGANHFSDWKFFYEPPRLPPQQGQTPPAPVLDKPAAITAVPSGRPR